MLEPRYRTAEAGDVDAIRRMVHLCFNAGEARANLSIERAGLNEIRVLELGRELAACTYLIPMGIFFGGRSVSNLGLAAVGVPPEARGRGISLSILQGALREAAERGYAVSTLHPATQTVYRKVGYQLFGGHYETRMPVATIDVCDRSADLRRYEEKDREALRTLHSRWARQFDGNLDRGEYVWTRVHFVGEQPTEGYVIEEGSEITGYCFLLQEPAHGFRYDLRASDLLASTANAARRLLSFFADHRSMGHELIWNGGPTDPLLLHVPEDRYQTRLKHFVMIRIVDVKRALESRGYPRLLRTKLELEISDPILPANQGRFVLDVADGQAEVVRGGSGALRMDANGLAALFGQMHPASRLAAMGWIEGDADTIERAGAIFAGMQGSVVELF
jgi:predicted acetyltransferase